MKKKLVILFTLIMVLSIALTITATCFAEETTEEATEVIEQPIVEEADESASAWFSNVWARCKEWIISAFSGLTVSTIVGAIVVVAVKRGTNKGFDKIEKSTNSQTIAELTTQKMLDKWANVTLDVNIEPVLKSQYKAISEQSSAELCALIKKQDEKNLAQLNAIKRLGGFFECSVAISDEAKEAFNKAIEEAEALYIEESTKATAVVAITAEEPKETKKANTLENY